VRQLTNSAGAVTDSYDYDAFGNLINSNGSTPNVYLFAGEAYDSALGLYYNRARYYNNTTGRFWSMDTYEGDRQSPGSLHKYLYSQSDPINHVDPSGRQVSDIVIAVTIAFTIAALAGVAYLQYGGLREHFGLIWSPNIDWSAPIQSQSNTPTGSFTSSEIQEMKDQALQSLKLAFAPYLVSVDEGRQGAHTAVVDNFKTVINGVPADGHTNTPGADKVSYIHYPNVSTDAQEVVGSSDLNGLALATGRGIGNASAHEIGHQFALSQMHVASDGFYEHDGATPSFFLQDQLQWTEQSQGELKSKLGANQ
jgi:RHS repeat-associated protein